MPSFNVGLLLLYEFLLLSNILYLNSLRKNELSFSLGEPVNVGSWERYQFEAEALRYSPKLSNLSIVSFKFDKLSVLKRPHVI